MTDFIVELVAPDGARITLGPEQRVGRSDDCEITIDDGRVSRKHALLRLTQQRATVEDLGSANGTSVNGKQVQGVMELQDGDTLGFDKHSYVVAISGPADPDATVVDMQATPVDTDATVVSAQEEDTGPVGAGAPPAAQELPGSWVDAGTSDQTRVLSMDSLPAGGVKGAPMDRASELPHLIVLGADGSRGGVLELQITAAQDVWEIGREPPCEIVINETSVSERHAQLIHQDGRWRVVNLVSTNGIFVNGEKKLTAYLADGDEIRLGLVTLVFRSALGADLPTSARQSPAGAAGPAGAGSGGKKRLLIAVAAIGLLVLLLLIGWVMR